MRRASNSLLDELGERVYRQYGAALDYCRALIESYYHRARWLEEENLALIEALRKIHSEPQIDGNDRATISLLRDIAESALKDHQEIKKLHALGCPFRTSATCSVPNACGHGRYVCPKCDACTCKSLAAQQQEARIQNPVKEKK